MRTELTSEERAVYEWQLWVDDFGEKGQLALRNASVLVSRCGGLGGPVAYELAAAGVGKLILAHEGNVEYSDLNRQLLMTQDWVGKPRIESAKRRLQELNPRLEVEAHNVNVNEENAAELVGAADLIIDCAPMFEERFAMNRQAVLQRKPIIECAMYDLEASITTIIPGQTPCLACVVPSVPPAWERQFPVIGAVSGAVGCMAVMEAVKVLAGFGKPLLGRMIHFDLRSASFSEFQIERDSDCAVCGSL
ncbi:MAG: HesA/MoeB/ThiF family protein [Candidatus Poribacteria bacterium]|nr:HesA/MoeB/ThiF family protein [Candidatus Poribacteria bacterium]